MNNFVFLSGLPRSGSTLLSAILSQNPKIHAEGNSAVCQLMWDMHYCAYNNSYEQLSANRRERTVFDLVSAIPNVYYKNIKRPIVVDKCRSWTLETNISLIREYITDDPKIIVLLRPVDQILKSFAKLRIDNGWSDANVNELLTPESEPVMRSVDGAINALNNHKENCIFITYDNLINDIKGTINKIYDFCEWRKYGHTFDKIQNKFPENDEVYGLIGQHDVRPSIEKRHIDFELDEAVINDCKILNNLMGMV